MPLAWLATARRVAILLAVRLHGGLRLLLLTFLDVGQEFTEPLVLGDRRIRHALVLVEHARLILDELKAWIEATLSTLPQKQKLAEAMRYQR